MRRQCFVPADAVKIAVIRRLYCGCSGFCLRPAELEQGCCASRPEVILCGNSRYSRQNHTYKCSMRPETAQKQAAGPTREGTPRHAGEQTESQQLGAAG